MTSAQTQMIQSVTSKMSPAQIREYVEQYGADGNPSTAPEHDEIIVAAALLGDSTAMLLCHMS